MLGLRQLRDAYAEHSALGRGLGHSLIVSAVLPIVQKIVEVVFERGMVNRVKCRLFSACTRS